MSKYEIDFYTKIQGIPCGVYIEDYEEDEFGVYFDPIITDRRGYEARWIANKLTDEDRDRINKEVMKHVKDERDEFKIDKWILAHE